MPEHRLSKSNSGRPLESAGDSSILANMTKARRNGLYLTIVGCAVFLFLGIALGRTSPASMIDFKVPYFGARCLLEHCDPYKQSAVLRICDAAGGRGPAESPGIRLSATRFVYQPTIFLFTAPFAMPKFGPAEELWMLLTLFLHCSHYGDAPGKTRR